MFDKYLQDNKGRLLHPQSCLILSLLRHEGMQLTKPLVEHWLALILVKDQDSGHMIVCILGCVHQVPS